MHDQQNQISGIWEKAACDAILRLVQTLFRAKTVIHKPQFNQNPTNTEEESESDSWTDVTVYGFLNL